jgi:ribosomal protein S24E
MVNKIENIDEKPLLARKEVKAKVAFIGKATPSNDDVRKAIASELKVEEKVVVMKHIYTAFGSSEADVEAYVYNSKEELEKFEPRKKKKEEKKEEDAEGAAPAEAAKAEEAPKEKKKEEPKKEAAKPEEKKGEAKPKEKEEASKEEKKE